MDEFRSPQERRSGDYGFSRKRMGGPLGPPQYIRRKLNEYGRATGKALRYKMYLKSKVANPNYGNVIVGAPAYEKRVLYRQGRVEPTTQLKTWAFNSASYWSSSIGKQRAIEFPCLDATMVGGLGSADNTVDGNGEVFYIKSYRHGVEISNTCNNTLFLKAYFLQVKTDGPSDPLAVYGLGLQDAGRANDTTLATYIEPTKLPRFNRNFRVTKMKEMSLGAGATGRVYETVKVGRFASLSNFGAGIGAAKGVTSYIMLVWHGAPARCTTTTPNTDGASIGPAEITVVDYGEVNYKTDNTNARVIYNLGQAVQSTTASAAVIMNDATDTSVNYAQI